MNKDFIDIIREIRGSGQHGVPYTSGIWYELTVADIDGNPGIYGDILAKYGVFKDNADAIKVIKLIQNEIQQVAAIDDSIVAITNSIDNITLVADNIDNVNTVADNEANINAVKANETNIATIVNIQAMLTSIYNDAGKLTSLFNDKAKLDSLYSNLTGLIAIYSNIPELLLVNDKAEEVAINTLATQLNADKAEQTLQSIQVATVIPLWISGSNYVAGKQVCDDATFEVYIALKNIINSTISPRNDAANWKSFSFYKNSLDGGDALQVEITNIINGGNANG